MSLKKVKDMNVKTIWLISGVNKARFLVQQECKCGLNENVCNST